MLIDTDVFIDALRGEVAAVRWLEATVSDGSALLGSVITRAELLAGMRPGEESRLTSMLEAIDWLPVSTAVADQGGAYRREFWKSHRLPLPDALIAATARLAEVTLATLNEKHFPMRDVRVLVPYRKG